MENKGDCRIRSRRKYNSKGEEIPKKYDAFIGLELSNILARIGDVTGLKKPIAIVFDPSRSKKPEIHLKQNMKNYFVIQSLSITNLVRLYYYFRLDN